MTKFKSWIKDRFFEPPRPFTTKRDLDMGAIKKFSALTVASIVLVLLLLPAPKAEKSGFHEQQKAGVATPTRSDEADPSREALSQLTKSQSTVRLPPASLDAYYTQPSLGGGGPSLQKRDTPMILGREGGDPKSQMPAGTKLAVRLESSVIVSSRSMPVIGRVAHDCLYEGNTVIQQGAKVYGEAALADDSDRVSVKWQVVELADGRQRMMPAIGVGADGQPGLEGDVHSEAWKNTIGQTLTRFIGAYAEGAMERGAAGASPGGAENGLKNAVAETAKDRAGAWAQGLEKEHKWVELAAGTESWALLTQPFVFRDPGAVHGR